MRTPRFTRIVMLCLLLVLVVPLSLHLTARPAHAAGNIYYVAADNGNDSCNGLAPDTNGSNCPWKTVAPVNSMTFQPGDIIAFKDGDMWTDPNSATDKYYLHPLGSGTNENPITIIDYCPTTGQLGGCSNNPMPYPILNGNGDGSPGGTLYLFNQSYWNISHLEIQNTCSSCSQLAYRQGILIQADNVGEVSGITLQNLTVDQVLGENIFSQEAKRTGGIIFDIEGPTGTGNTPTYFSGVTVSNVTVHNVARSGIFFYSVWKGPVTMGNSPPYNCPPDPDLGYTARSWTPSISVNVSYNTLYHISGDGIVVTDSLYQMISNNVVDDAHVDGNNAAGIWSEDSYEATIKDNEVYDLSFQNGDGDGEAFDSDRCDIVAIFEYNYSHENDGGFLLTIPYVPIPLSVTTSAKTMV